MTARREKETEKRGSQNGARCPQKKGEKRVRHLKKKKKVHQGTRRRASKAYGVT